MRKLKTHYIGRLVSFAGTVTRTSEVRPELFSGTFKCLNCGTLKRNVPQQFRYTEPLLCGDPTCGNAYVQSHFVHREWRVLSAHAQGCMAAGQGRQHLCRLAKGMRAGSTQ